MEFGRFAAKRRANRGQRRPETFDFLGFTHVCGVTRTNGRFTVWRLTNAKRMRAALQAIRQVPRRRRHEPTQVIGTWLRRVVQHFNYHAVPGNIVRLARFRDEVSRAWLFALRRRSQRRRMPWARFLRLVERYLPAARILHPLSSAKTRLCGCGQQGIFTMQAAQHRFDTDPQGRADAMPGGWKWRDRVGRRIG